MRIKIRLVHVALMTVLPPVSTIVEKRVKYPSSSSTGNQSFLSAL